MWLVKRLGHEVGQENFMIVSGILNMKANYPARGGINYAMIIDNI